MEFIFEKNELAVLEAAEKNCWLLTNGLGGFASASAAFSVTRCDQGLLISAESPSRRFNLVHRVSEELIFGGEKAFLSSQRFAGESAEDGFKSLEKFTFGDGAEWVHKVGDVRVVRRFAMAYCENASALTYRVENRSQKPCVLNITPIFQMSQKGDPPQKKLDVSFLGGCVSAGGLFAYVRSSAELKNTPLRFERLYYPDDEKDGRRESGLGFSCLQISLTVKAGECAEAEIVFSSEKTEKSGFDIISASIKRRRELIENSGFKTPEAAELCRAADAFSAYRESTGGKTLIAGYPFFGDWGRDTMIAMQGCTLSTKRYSDAKSILKTFLSFEKDGLLPNYFPEGRDEPQYNSADAPLLLINCVWLYYEKTRDENFLRLSFPTLKRIVKAYESGTKYAIKADSDGLISAGEGLDQVTWMDVRIGDVLPTPRHGKPVELNAYWYSDLCAMAQMAKVLGDSGDEYSSLAERVRVSFNEKFPLSEQGYLKDVISGTSADFQLRCNQIWALSMPFTMLSKKQAERVLEAVEKHLLTPCGLRTLSPDDPQFRPFYGGPQSERDLAYHQGTVWVFPAGAYYLALLKYSDDKKSAAKRVRKMLADMPDILREGCLGQLPEIYDGLEPKRSKGCFAQAWSVGEMLRVYEALEEIEAENED